jgi:hypothetical protein
MQGDSDLSQANQSRLPLPLTGAVHPGYMKQQVDAGLL